MGDASTGAVIAAADHWAAMLDTGGTAPSRLGETVIVRLSEAILEGKLKPGDALPSEGRIIIHEMLYNDEKTGPFAVAAFSVQMLLWAPGGEQYSGRELSTMLTEAGFVDVERIEQPGSDILAARKPF